MKPLKEIKSYDHVQFRKSFLEERDAVFSGTPSFKIYRIEDVLPYIKFPLPHHRSPYFEILFVTAGASTTRHSGLMKYEICSDQIFFKSAHQISSGDISGTDTTGFFCLIDNEFLVLNGQSAFPIAEFPFFKSGSNPCMSLSHAQALELDRLFGLIHSKWNGNQKNKHTITAAYLNVLLQELQAMYVEESGKVKNTRQAAADVLTEKFKRLVEQHYLHKQKVLDYAELLFVTPNHLNKTIKATTGKTALELIDDMLLLEAKVLLKQTNKNVSEIAFHLSFDDPSHFTRFFKHLTGRTPLAFRNLE